MNKYLLLCFGFLLSFVSLAQSSNDLWGEIRDRMAFDHALEQPSVLYELEKYNENKSCCNVDNLI